MSAKSIFLKLAFLCWLIAVVCYPVSVFCVDKTLPVVIDGDEVSYLQSDGKVVARGKVKMNYQGTEIFCDEADYDANAHIANIRGNVKIIKENTTMYGEYITYNFTTQAIQMEKAKIESPPLYGRAEHAEKAGQNKYILKRGYVTTCSLDNPHYRFKAKTITVYPQDKVVSKNVVWLVGKTPVFYMPYFCQSLKEKTQLVTIMPGKNKELGNYVISRWRYHLSPGNRGRINFDYYERRGKAYGVDHKLESEKFGELLVHNYKIKDKLYVKEEENERDRLFDQYPERYGLSEKYLRDNRYKIELSHSKTSSRLSSKTEFYKFSDQYFRKDFFYREYEIDGNPISYNLLDYTLDNSSFSLLTQKRVNHFYSQVEYLPQLNYSLYTQKIGETKFYFQSESKAGNVTSKTANSDIEQDTLRLHSVNTLSYIDKLKWLNIHPYLTGTNSFYATSFEDKDILRGAVNPGIDFSTNLYRVFNSNFNLLGQSIDKMRHVITPTVKYSYAHNPTVPNERIFQYDSSDSLAKSESVTFTLNNKLQAKKDKEIKNILFFAPSVDYIINQENKGSYYNTINSKLEVYPCDRISLTTDTGYLVSTKRINSVNLDLTLRDTAKEIKDTKDIKGSEDNKSGRYTLSYGHRYVRTSSTQGTFNLDYMLLSKIQVRNYVRYEYNTGDLQEQRHSLRFDLHCWWLDFEFHLQKRRDVGIGDMVRDVKDNTFMLVFTLKGFEDFAIGSDYNYKGAKKSY